jgi:hypothetical protein
VADLHRLVALLLLPGLAVADAEMCDVTRYRITHLSFSSGWHSSPGDAAAEWAEYWCSDRSDITGCSAVPASGAACGGTNLRFRVTFSQVDGSGPTQTGSTCTTSATFQEECPDCADLEGDQKYFVADIGYPVGAIPTLCLTSFVGGTEIKCQFEYYGHVGGVSGGFGMLAPQYNATGEGCLIDDQPEEYADYELPENATCWQGAAGLVCVDPVPQNAKNCGTVDGEWVCVQSVPPGGCTYLAGGALACDSTAPSQPDIGDGETPATPAAQFVGDNAGTGTGSTVNYYTASQVSNSETVITGAGGGAGPRGDGDGEGGGGGSGSASGDCGVPPSCEGDAIQCAILQQSWFQRCSDPLTEGEVSELVGDVQDVGEGELVELPAGLDDELLGAVAATCPAPVEVTVFGEVKEISWEFFCDLAGMANPLVVLLAYLQGAFIVFGAFRGAS